MTCNNGTTFITHIDANQLLILFPHMTTYTWAQAKYCVRAKLFWQKNNSRKASFAKWTILIIRNTRLSDGDCGQLRMGVLVWAILHALDTTQQNIMLLI